MADQKPSSERWPTPLSNSHQVFEEEELRRYLDEGRFHLIKSADGLVEAMANLRGGLIMYFEKELKDNGFDDGSARRLARRQANKAVSPGKRAAADMDAAARGLILVHRAIAHAKLQINDAIVDLRRKRQQKSAARPFKPTSPSSWN